MLEVGNDYYIAWGCYLLAVIVLQFLVWRATLLLPIKDLRTVINIIVFSLMVTPTQLEMGQNYWVPVFIAALMEILDEGFSIGIMRMLPALIVMFVLLLASIATKFLKPKSS
jgi:hypothetical protein